MTDSLLILCDMIIHTNVIDFFFWAHINIFHLIDLFVIENPILPLHKKRSGLKAENIEPVKPNKIYFIRGILFHVRKWGVSGIVLL